MLSQLKKRFIFFNVLVISCVLIIVGSFILLGSTSTISLHRFVIVILVCILLVIIASLILSQIALRPIEKAWQKQLEFTANASHELRTPLSIIQSNLEIVMDNSDKAVKSQEKWLNNIYAENKRMSHLVADLLTLSRADTNAQELNLSVFYLNKIIDKVAATYTPLALKNNITIQTHYDFPIQFIGDYSRIQQLLIILVDNSIRYMDVEGLIQISLSEVNQKIHLIIKDNGKGIIKEDLDKIFDRFYRGDGAIVQNKEGSGLGLSIAQWIVKSHHGTIQVKSEPNKGTSFFIEFPQI